MQVSWSCWVHILTKMIPDIDRSCDDLVLYGRRRRYLHRLRVSQTEDNTGTTALTDRWRRFLASCLFRRVSCNAYMNWFKQSLKCRIMFPYLHCRLRQRVLCAVGNFGEAGTSTPFFVLLNFNWHKLRDRLRSQARGSKVHVTNVSCHRMSVHHIAFRAVV